MRRRPHPLRTRGHGGRALPPALPWPTATLHPARGDVPGAVHGLDPVGLAVNVHWGIHEVLIVLQMPRGLVDSLAGNMRGIDQIIAALEVLLFPEVLYQVADHSELGMPQNQAGPHVL